MVRDEVFQGNASFLGAKELLHVIPIFWHKLAAKRGKELRLPKAHLRIHLFKFNLTWTNGKWKNGKEGGKKKVFDFKKIVS